MQSLQGVPPGGLRKIILTASGGAFRDWDKADLAKVRVQDALKHPNWAMGTYVRMWWNYNPNPNHNPNPNSNWAMGAYVVRIMISQDKG